MRVCFIALEILGPFQGGGIATALAGQAEHHAKDHDVTVLYVHPGLRAEDAAQWEEFYAARNIRFVRAEFDTFYPLDTIPKRSFAVKEYLEAWDEEFDVLFFHDYLGLGYYTALSRQLGLGFGKTLIGSVIHGPSEWARSLNMVRDKEEHLTLYELEKKQIEYSDFAVAPSQDIIDWCAEQGWDLPEDTRPISNILPHRLDLHTGLSQGDRVEIDEICFFGRLETRKGVFTFLDAIKYLHKNGLALPRKVTFLGAFCVNGFRNSASTVLEYARDWDCEFTFLNNYGHEEAIRYLVENKPLTVIPSRDESFGLTAYECLAFGIPCLIAERGALRTLAAEPERSELLFEPAAHVLARRLDECLTEGVVIGAVDPMHLNSAEVWDQLLSDLSGPVSAPDSTLAVACLDTEATPAPVIVVEPLVSVILVHHNRVSTLKGALASLLAQSYENIEIIISDDGSRAADFAALEQEVAKAGDPRVQVVRQENSYLGAARNFGVSHAKGDYLLFMDDDNVASVDEIKTFVQVALATGADVLNSVSRMFRMAGQERMAFDVYLPVGPSLQLAVLGNTFGDANALVRRSTFEELGGFTEQYAVGCEDYEFFTRAYLSGKRMQLIPEYLFDYRSEDEGMMKELNSGRYIVNQMRGVTAFFDTHRQIDLTEMRRLLRYSFYNATEVEYDYWMDQATKGRRHPELEGRLARQQDQPNGPLAVEIVAQMLAAEGQISDALGLIERNRIAPTDAMLARLQELNERREAMLANSGVQPNVVVNPVFEFWTLGNRFEGVHPYQYIANEWLVPSSKPRPSLIVSQRSDNALLWMSTARSGSYIRMQLNAPDPEGYLFLSQRNFELGGLLEQELRLSFLIRASFSGAVPVFLRFTEKAGTSDFRDIHSDQTTQASQNWERVTLSFNLGDVKAEDAGTGSFLSVFFGMPHDHVKFVDLTDVSLVPAGDEVEIAPYNRVSERQRAAERCFTIGQDAEIIPGEGTAAELKLSPVQAEKIARDSRFHILDSCVILQADGVFKDALIDRVAFKSAGAGEAVLELTMAEPLQAGGVVMRDLVAVTNYLEG